MFVKIWVVLILTDYSKKKNECSQLTITVEGTSFTQYNEVWNNSYADLKQHWVVFQPS